MRALFGPTRGDSRGRHVVHGAPLAHTFHGIRDYLRRSGISHVEPAANLVAIPLTSGLLEKLAEGLGSALSQAELADTRSLLTGADLVLDLSALAAMEPLATLFSRVQNVWFVKMLGERRLTTHFQPIVHACDPGCVFAYECLLRGVTEGGELVKPDRLYRAARDSDLLYALDRAARVSAIRAAARRGLTPPPGFSLTLIQRRSMTRLLPAHNRVRPSPRRHCRRIKSCSKSWKAIR